MSPPTAGAQRLADHVRGHGEADRLARALLLDTWVVDSLADLPDAFDAVAVTRSGRVWSARAHELRQAPAVGEERVLAERNRREELVRASEAAAQAEIAARAALERAGHEASGIEEQRENSIAAHRAAVRGRDEAAEEQRRLAALIDRRRSAPDDGPNAGRRSQLAAELSAERRMLERAERTIRRSCRCSAN
jgi:chromosome segregation protein